LVKFPDINTYEITDVDAGGDDTKDSDANVNTGWSPTVNLESGEHDPTIDAGYFEAASLGDYTWYDKDGDGIQENGEKCIDSVKIFLYSVTDLGGGVLDTIKLDSTWSHAVINPQDETDTIKCGYYEFNRLKPGKYFLVFENPDDTKYQISPKDELFDDTKDSDINDLGNTATINVQAGDHIETIDAGFYKGECLEGLVWFEDTDNDVPNVQDASDIPQSGIEVFLYSEEDENDPNDDILVAQAITDEDGLFNFGNLPIGNYFVSFTIPQPFANIPYTLVKANMGGDDNYDSDFYYPLDGVGDYNDPHLVRSYQFSIEANDDNTCKDDVDAGIHADLTTPLDLLSFNANWSKSEKVVKLNWKTINEIDIDYFIIEKRSESESEYEEVDRVNANGGRAITAYELDDSNVEKGIIYSYRLIPVNLDGKFDGYYNANIFVPADELTVRAYPNPVRDILNILITGSGNNEISVEILDNVGRRAIEKVTVDNINTNDKVSINLEDLPQGQYYVKVVSGNDVRIMKLVHVR